MPATSHTAPADLKYEPVPYWAKVPHGMTFRGSATSVAVDSKDRVYVFNRGSHPLMVFDNDGNLLNAWSDESRFGRPHNIRIDQDQMFLVDDGGHVIEKVSLEGDVLLTLGERDRPSEPESGEVFNRPTDIAVHASTGDLFVADGYGNSRVHRFASNGELITSWGESGADPGQFSLPHSILVTKHDRVMVCDRENFRIQIFDINGEYLGHWHAHRPFCISEGSGEDPLIFVGEGGSIIPNRQGIHRLGNCVKVFTSDGIEVARFGGELPGFGPDQFQGLHSIAVDSRGDVYVAEVANAWIGTTEGPLPLGEWPSLRKWRLVSS